jgi:hypothetical protein
MCSAEAICGKRCIRIPPRVHDDRGTPPVERDGKGCAGDLGKWIKEKHCELWVDGRIIGRDREVRSDGRRILSMQSSQYIPKSLLHRFVKHRLVPVSAKTRLDGRCLHLRFKFVER